jgi:hypothetical protein
MVFSLNLVGGTDLCCAFADREGTPMHIYKGTACKRRSKLGYLRSEVANTISAKYDEGQMAHTVGVLTHQERVPS